MLSRLPDINSANTALRFDPEERGFKELGKGFASWRVENAEELCRVPEIAGEGSIMTLRELVQARIEGIENALQVSGIDLRTVGTDELIETVRRNATSITENLGPTWSKRFNTRTATVMTPDEMVITDIHEHDFRDPDLIDYTEIKDGGARIKKQDIPGETYGRIPLALYMKAQGGNRGLIELHNHAVIQGLIPEQEMRGRYLTALGVLNMKNDFELGSESIWVPRGLDTRNGFRWYALGAKADAFYPPNFTTKYMELILQKKK